MNLIGIKGGENVPDYEEGEVYVCEDPSCKIEVTITKGCTESECPVSQLVCCNKPMVKKS